MAEEEKKPEPRHWDFYIPEEEVKSIEAWLEEHNKTCRYASRASQGAIGGRLQYCFAPTSLGTVVKVNCACGAEHDATDYKSW
jgi:hypothetical protein